MTEGLPNGERIEVGLADLRAGDMTVDALLVAIGAPRLRSLGFAVDTPSGWPWPPEHELYRALAETHGDDAHSQYNALIRQLVSFEHAVELLQARSRRRGEVFMAPDW